MDERIYLPNKSIQSSAFQNDRQTNTHMLITCEAHVLHITQHSIILKTNKKVNFITFHFYETQTWETCQCNKHWTRTTKEGIPAESSQPLAFQCHDQQNITTLSHGVLALLFLHFPLFFFLINLYETVPALKKTHKKNKKKQLDTIKHQPWHLSGVTMVWSKTYLSHLIMRN